MRRRTNILIALLLVCGAGSTTALADGGQIRVSRRCGDFHITVFTSPNPMRVGPVDVSVLVQDVARGEVIPDARVVVELSPVSGENSTIRRVATRRNATNKLLQAAVAEVHLPGRWDGDVTVTVPHADSSLEVNFAMDVGPPLPRWLAVWPWFSWPIVAVLLFAAHRGLVARRAAARPDRTRLCTELLPIVQHASSPR